MIVEGRVSSTLDVCVPLLLRDSLGVGHEIDAIIDTGFDGSFCLPRTLINELQLSFAGETEVVLGDGQSVHLSVFEANVEFGGRIRCVDALQAEGSPLVGMKLLLGYRVTIDVIRDGRVAIQLLEELT